MQPFAEFGVGWANSCRVITLAAAAIGPCLAMLVWNVMDSAHLHFLRHQCLRSDAECSNKECDINRLNTQDLVRPGKPFRVYRAPIRL